MCVLLRDGREVRAEWVNITPSGTLELRRSFGDPPFMLIAAGRWDMAEREEPQP